MEHESLSDIQKHWHGYFKYYVVGFILSILLTLCAYFVVSEKWLAGWPLILAVAFLAIAQAIAQLILFLHLGQEKTRPQWNLFIFLFMLSILLIIVFGTLWIMFNLNERVM